MLLFFFTGAALIAGACQKFIKANISGSFALIRDQGAFDGVMTAAHKLGRLYEIIIFFYHIFEKKKTIT